MIKLTRIQSDGHDPVVHIEGRLDAETVHELTRYLGANDIPQHVALDLSGLTSLDHDGRSALVRLRGGGHRLVGASLYIHHLLQEATP